jgi:hypothetical protein
MIDSMGNSKWIENIIEILKVFSSEEFQNRVWLKGQGPEISSYIEAVCELSDFQIDLLIDSEWKKVGLTNIQRDSLVSFRETINEFNKKVPDSPTDLDIISHPDWINVRCQARYALDTFQNKL